MGYTMYICKLDILDQKHDMLCGWHSHSPSSMVKHCANPFITPAILWNSPMNAREGNDMVKVTDIGNTGATILELHALAHIQSIGYCTRAGLF